MKVRLPLVYLIAIFALATCLALVTRPSVVKPAHAAPSAVGLFPDLEGTWEGSWADTVFFVAGAITFEVTRDGDAYFGEGSIDVTLIDPKVGVVGGSGSGSLSLGVLSGSFSAASLGSGTVTVTAVTGRGEVQAEATGSGSVSGGAFEFGPFEFEGTVTEGFMAGRFSFTNEGAGAGVAALTKTSTPTDTRSWSDLKGRHRER